MTALDLTQRESYIPPPAPPGQANESKLRDWVRHGLYYNHPLRARDMSSNRRAELYDSGFQWLQRAMAGYDSGTASQWVSTYWDTADPKSIPMPVFNEGVGARMNESARLQRPNYQPLARAKGENPDIKQVLGAKKCRDMLLHRLREMGWDKGGERLYYAMPVYGGAWLKSEWVMTWDKTTTVPLTTAVKCPGCGFTLASKTVPLDKANQVAGIAQNVTSANIGSGKLQVDACPQCPDHPAMLPYPPTMQEAQQGKDSIGQPLGKQVPMGDWLLRVASDYDVFPRNLGLDMMPGFIPEWTEAHVENLDWVALRYPDKAADVQPENAATLARYHPIAGSPDVLAGVLETKMFDNSTRIVERHRLPSMQPIVAPDGSSVKWVMDRGRSVGFAGDRLLYDEYFLLESQNYPGEYVERIVMDYIPWELREGGRRLRGLSLWEILFDPQDSANTVRSQAQSVRERMALPLYVFLRDHNVGIKAMQGGIPGRFAEIDLAGEKHVMPEVMNNITIDPGAWRELEDAKNAIERFGLNTTSEQGYGHAGDPAEAIRLLKEASGERREPRIRRIGVGLKRGYAHGARLMQHMYIEPRPCRYEDEDGEDRWTSFQGIELGRDVEIDVEPETHEEDEKRLIVKDLVASEVLNPQESPRMRRAIAKYYGAPEDLFEDVDLQDKSAQLEWIDFKEKNLIPQLDPTLDDHAAHFDMHGRAAHTAWFRDLARRAHWNAALKHLSNGWWETLNQIANLPPGPLCLQDSIFDFWTKALESIPPTGAQQQTGFQQQEGLDADGMQALEQVLYWRAHMEAHRLEDQIKQQRAALQPTLPAPGADATPAGNQPTEQAPPAQPPPPPMMPMPPQPAGVH